MLNSYFTLKYASTIDTFQFHSDIIMTYIDGLFKLLQENLSILFF